MIHKSDEAKEEEGGREETLRVLFFSQNLCACAYACVYACVSVDVCARVLESARV